MTIKKLKEINNTYTDMINHLKGKIKPIGENVNSDMMVEKENAISEAGLGEEFKSTRFLSELNAGLFMGVSAFVVLKDAYDLLGYTAVTGFLAWYLNSKYTKQILLSTIVKKSEYTSFLQAMAEDEMKIVYPFDFGDLSNYKKVKFMVDKLENNGNLFFYWIKDNKINCIKYNDPNAQIQQFDMDEWLKQLTDDFAEDEMGQI